MQQLLSENLEQFDNELLTKQLEEVPVERLLRVLEQRRGLSSQEVLRALPPEEFVAGLSEEEAARLRELLARKQGDLTPRPCSCFNCAFRKTITQATQTIARIA